MWHENGMKIVIFSHIVQLSFFIFFPFALRRILIEIQKKNGDTLHILTSQAIY